MVQLLPRRTRGRKGLGTRISPFVPEQGDFWDGRIFSGGHEPIDQSRSNRDTPALGIKTLGAHLVCGGGVSLMSEQQEIARRGDFSLCWRL